MVAPIVLAGAAAVGRAVAPALGEAVAAGATRVGVSQATASALGSSAAGAAPRTASFLASAASARLGSNSPAPGPDAAEAPTQPPRGAMFPDRPTSLPAGGSIGHQTYTTALMSNF